MIVTLRYCQPYLEMISFVVETSNDYKFTLGADINYWIIIRGGAAEKWEKKRHPLAVIYYGHRSHELGNVIQSLFLHEKMLMSYNVPRYLIFR